ncbi:MAG TPA: serine hydrolase domain-containing protein [Tahibacter sp.]|nr:serine hydrolase domain-containing protein [Tahibacter sp.]
MQDSSDTRLQRALAAAKDESSLRGRLDAIVQRKGLQAVCLGVAADGRALTFSAGTAETEAADAADAPVFAGCLAKSLTATLVNDAVAAGRLAWTDAAADILAGDAQTQRQLAGITVRQLVDHAHGLDASTVRGVPRTGDGYIDVAALCGALDPQPLFAPGRMYSYGHAGAWLAGAVLERIGGARYATQLRERQICDAMYGESDAICSATGMALALTVTQWLAFAQRSCTHLQAPPDGTHDDRALPGWHPNEQAVRRGWKCYGDGWFGHNANLVDRSALLRVNPHERLAIVISASDPNGAVFAASGVFGDLLPEFRHLRPPRLLKADEVAALDVHAHVGRYVQARTTVEVTLDAQGALQLRAGERDRDAVPASRLRAADRGVFIAESRGNPEFQFVQFIDADASGASAFLWNGKQVWRRDGAAAGA